MNLYIKRSWIVDILTLLLFIVASLLQSYSSQGSTFLGINLARFFSFAFVVVLVLYFLFGLLSLSLNFWNDRYSKKLNAISTIVHECNSKIAHEFMNFACDNNDDRLATVYSLLKIYLSKALLEFNPKLKDDTIIINLFFEHNKTWEIFERDNTNSLTLPELLRPTSTLHSLMNDNVPYHFFTNKKKAAKQGKYAIGTKDISELKGSIYGCRNITTFSNETFELKACFFISTYKRNICRNNKDIKEFIQNEIFRPFENYFWLIVACKNKFTNISI